MLQSYLHACRLGMQHLRGASFCPSPFTPAPPAPPRFHVPQLDGLRGLALIWVLSFHTLYFLGAYFSKPDAHEITSMCAATFPCTAIPNGHLAVDVFFVLSGYLVAHNLHHPHFQSLRKYDARTNRFRSTKVFFTRRLFRIMPCFYFTFLLYCVIAGLVQGDGGPRKCSGVSEVLKNLLFYQNNYPIREQCMAWAWTVSVEVQFYVLTPFLLFAPSWLGQCCETHEWGKMLRSPYAPLFTMLMPAAYSIHSRTVIPLEYSPVITATAVLESTNHESNDPYFDRMYSSSETRLFACYVGAMGGVVVSMIRNPNNGRGSGSSSSSSSNHGNGGDNGCSRSCQSTFFAALSFASFAALLGIIFTDWSTETFETDEESVNFLAWSRVVFCVLVTTLIVGFGGQSTVVPTPTEAAAAAQPKSLSMKILTLPDSLLTPHPLKLPFLTPVLHVVSYPAFLLHPLTVNGFYLLAVSGGDEDNAIAGHIFSSTGWTLLALVLFNALIMFTAAAAMHVLVETPGAELGKWVEKKMAMADAGGGGSGGVSEGGFSLQDAEGGSSRGRGAEEVGIELVESEQLLAGDR
jgi:peptidoglycan/LPS O-acetylase OafA/YrhL